MVVEVGVDAGGARDYFGPFDGAIVGGLDDVLESAAEFALSSREEAGGARVAIDGSLADLVVPRNLVGAAPVDEIIFNVFAVPVRADDAFAGMAGEVGRMRSAAEGSVVRVRDARWFGGRFRWRR